MADEKSGAGAVLGGVAAVILAVATLYATLHKDAPAPPPAPTPVILPKAAESTPTQAAEKMRFPAPVVAPRKTGIHERVLSEPRTEKPQGIEGRWYEVSRTGNLIVNVYTFHVKPGGLVSGSVDSCDAYLPLGHPHVLDADSTWDGEDLVAHITYSSLATGLDTIRLKFNGDVLEGTDKSAVHTFPITLHRESIECPVHP